MSKNAISPYSCIVFRSGGNPLKYVYVRNIVALSLWLSANVPGWLYINVYNRKTGQFLNQSRKNSFIIQFPAL